MSPSDGRQGSETPLEGWKEIAAYLQRDVSTVRRWEKEEGLPVHRHEHQTRSSVYAYPADIDAWRIRRAASPPPPVLGLRARPSWFGFAVAAALLAALIAVSRSSLLRPVAEAQSPGVGIRTVEVCGKCDWTGSVSPDGRFISETDWGSLNAGLRELGTEILRPITSTGSQSEGFGAGPWHVFSPDGRFLAIRWHRSDVGRELRKISVESLDGQTTVLYSSDEMVDIRPAGWSMDGEILIAGQRSDRTTVLAFVPAEGGDLRVVKVVPFGGFRVHLSRDGKWIAYDLPSKDHVPRRDVYLLSSDGSQEVLVSNHRANDYAVGFTPGSEAILFASNRTGTYGLWAANIRAGGVLGEPRLIQRDIGPIVPLTIAPDGALYFARAIGAKDIFTAEIDWATGKLLSEPRIVEGSRQGANRGPVWAPDGKSFAYRSGENVLFDHQGGPIRLVVRSWPDGREREILPPSLEINAFFRMRYSPDGRRIMLWARDMQDRYGIYEVDLETGEAELLRSKPPNIGLRAAGWGADGKTWYYVANDSGREVYSIMRMDPGSEDGVEIYSISDRGREGSIWFPIISPRGDRMAFRVLGGQQIWVLPLDGGEPTKVFESPDGGWPESLAWAPEGDALVVVVASPKLREHQGLYRIPIDGGPRTKLDLLGDRMSRISIHPGGKTIVYQDGNPETRIWKMENYWSPEAPSEE